MKFRIFPTLKGYKREYLLKDIFAGLIITAVSIPISMGYAEIAGLPAVYGLYASVLPILVFALFSTSPQFIFGVDAAPAAIVGGMLSSAGIAAGTQEAEAFVPLVTLFTACWLLIFAFMRAGKILRSITRWKFRSARWEWISGQAWSTGSAISGRETTRKRFRRCCCAMRHS